MRSSATADPASWRSWATRPSCTTATACSRPPRRSAPTSSSWSADNDGGGIFSSLEQGAPQHAATFERVFGVPLSLDVAALSAALGMPALVASTSTELISAIDEAVGTGGVRIVVARTASRAQEAATLVNVQRAVGEALGSA